MHKSELKAHPTLINYVIKEYELRVGTMGIYNSIENTYLNPWDIMVSHWEYMLSPAFINNDIIHRDIWPL